MLAVGKKVNRRPCIASDKECLKEGKDKKRKKERVSVLAATTWRRPLGARKEKGENGVLWS